MKKSTPATVHELDCRTLLVRDDLEKDGSIAAIVAVWQYLVELDMGAIVFSPVRRALIKIRNILASADMVLPILPGARAVAPIPGAGGAHSLGLRLQQACQNLQVVVIAIEPVTDSPTDPRVQEVERYLELLRNEHWSVSCNACFEYLNAIRLDNWSTGPALSAMQEIQQVLKGLLNQPAYN